MMKIDAFILLFVSLLQSATPWKGPRFSNVFQSHMVLQRDEVLRFWGFDAGENETLRICFGSLCHHTQCNDVGAWHIEFQAQSASITPRDLWVIRERDGQGHSLEDVVVGDVFLFSGQSNIGIPEAYGHQVDRFRADPTQSGPRAQLREEQIADTLGAVGLLRMRIVDVPSSVNASSQLELPATLDCDPCPPPFALGVYSWCQCSQMAWTRPSAVKLRGFSAISWFTGVALRNSVALLEGVPIGVVVSAVGGSAIDSWSSADAKQVCAPSAPPVSPGGFWSMMIAPLVGVQFKAITWYQGENNLGNPAYYQCALAAMISDWKVKLGWSSIPFVVVQLQPWCTAVKYCDDKTAPISTPAKDLAEMRLAQDAAASSLPHVSLVTAMDLGSLHSQAGSCHSAQKPELGQRLAFALRTAVYDNHSFWKSPRARSASLLGTDVAVDFEALGGRGLSLDMSVHCPPEILHVFCTGAGFEICTGSNCVLAASASLHRNGTRVILGTSFANVGAVTSIRYAFADWPVIQVRDAVTRLPVLPFHINITNEESHIEQFHI